MIKRNAVRALLLSPGGRLLLMKLIEPKSKRAVWLTPGGGIQAGESPAVGLRREIFEETGLADFEIGPEVWRREHRFNWNGRAILQRERFFVVKVNPFEPTEHHNADEVEQNAFGGFRWWSAPEIEQSNEVFAPRRLGGLLQALIQDGPPTHPIFLAE